MLLPHLSLTGMKKERRQNWVSPSWWQDYNKWQSEISLLYKMNKHDFSVVVYTIIWWLSIAILLIPSQSLKFFWPDLLRVSFFKMYLHEVKGFHITHSRENVLLLLCFTYHTTSYHSKAVSQASVSIVFHVTLKLQSGI